MAAVVAIRHNAHAKALYDLLSQGLALGGSLARLYYLYHGALTLADDHLQRAQRLFTPLLPQALIEQFEQAPEVFKGYDGISEEEVQLLKRYSQEYLYQTGTFTSQLVQRGQIPITVIQDFEKSIAIQKNLGEHVNPQSIAYTMRNFARALRKQTLLVNGKETYDELAQWIADHPTAFDEITRARLLVDQGIVQKELEDTQPEDQRNYDAAINQLIGTQTLYLHHATANQYGDLGMLSIYLGEIGARDRGQAALGDALDAIAAYGPSRLFGEVAFEIALEHDLLGERMPVGTTSFSVHGAYEREGESGEEVDELVETAVTHGYSKDHRPDLKQVVLSLAMTGDSAVPLWMMLCDGNDARNDPKGKRVRRPARRGYHLAHAGRRLSACVV